DEVGAVQFADMVGIVMVRFVRIDGPVGRGDHQDAAGAQHAANLRHEFFMLGDVFEGFETHHGVDGAVGNRQRGGVPHAKRDVAVAYNPIDQVAAVATSRFA